MNRVLGHVCAHLGSTVPREPPEDDEMDEMTLPVIRHTSERGRNILFL